jgi:glutathione S-transferase
LYYKGFQIRVPPDGQATEYKNINAWFDAMEKLESYQLTKSDYFTHAWDLPPQLGGCTTEQTGEVYSKAIDGGSWNLPLQPHAGGEPDWSWVTQEEAKRQAVERVTSNIDAISAFAARGAGTKGFPPVSAPLADPNASSNEAVQPAVKTVLQVVCMAILTNVEEQQDAMQQVANLLKDNDFGADVVASLAYMRDRVGVPRDMTLPAARQLRAHLNWAIDTIETA